jgi:serine/threonine protein kinase
MKVNKKIGKYILEKEIGRGNFAVVYKASKVDGPNAEPQRFAIKCINKKQISNNSVLKRLLQTEVAIMNKINHPNVMHLYEYIETENNFYLVINYCNKGDVESFLKRNKIKYLKEKEVVKILAQIRNGFIELRRYSVMHRDLKLSNIFLHDETVIIGDFGFAKTGKDMTGTVLGTPLTMAPELIAGKASYSSKADLWSLGVIVYQLLYGKVPFFGLSLNEVYASINNNSGSKLKLPEKNPVSNVMKRLLVSLLQELPDNRIEWKDFFNHEIFANSPSLRLAKSPSSTRNNPNEIKYYTSPLKNIGSRDVAEKMADDGSKDLNLLYRGLSDQKSPSPSPRPLARVNSSDRLMATTNSRSNSPIQQTDDFRQQKFRIDSFEKCDQMVNYLRQQNPQGSTDPIIKSEFPNVITPSNIQRTQLLQQSSRGLSVPPPEGRHGNNLGALNSPSNSEPPTSFENRNSRRISALKNNDIVQLLKPSDLLIENYFRYCHEMNKISFMLDCSRKSIELILNAESITPESEYIITAAILIVKKAHLFVNEIYDSLMSHNNIFGLSRFQEFAGSSRYSRLVDEFTELMGKVSAFRNKISENFKIFRLIHNFGLIKLFNDNMPEAQIEALLREIVAKLLSVCEAHQKGVQWGNPHNPSASGIQQRSFFLNVIFIATIADISSMIPYWVGTNKFNWEVFLTNYEKMFCEDLFEVMRRLNQSLVSK